MEVVVGGTHQHPGRGEARNIGFLKQHHPLTIQSFMSILRRCTASLKAYMVTQCVCVCVCVYVLHVTHSVCIRITSDTLCVCVLE